MTLLATHPVDVQDAALLRSVADEAGRLALSYFKAAPKQWEKDGGSPVSEADIAVDRFLKSRLTAARGDYGWVSEESERRDVGAPGSRAFVVDPIDGTRAFLNGDPAWSVALAIVENGRPVAAAIAEPVAGVVHHASLGSGAFADDERVTASHVARFADARLSGPRKLVKRAEVAASKVGVGRFVPSLALRMARVATGTVDIAFATANAHDWDLAAADLLVHEAGGRLSDSTGRPITYLGPRGRHPAIVGAAAGVHEAARSLLLRLVG